MVNSNTKKTLHNASVCVLPLLLGFYRFRYFRHKISGGNKITQKATD